MKFPKLVLALACLMSGTLLAQEAKVTELYVERPDELSRQRRSDDHRGVSAGQCGSQSIATTHMGLFMCWKARS